MFCIVVLGVLKTVPAQVLGHPLPDPVPDAITGNVTIDGAVFCGGLGGQAVLNLDENDTLFVLGEADLTDVTFSDPTAGTIVFVTVVDSVNIVDSVVFGSLEVNNFEFAAVASGSGQITLKLVGDYLEAHGNVVRHFSRSWKQTLLGSKERRTNVVVHGDMLMEHFSDEDPPSTGWPGTARNNFYADSLTFYGDVVLHTWYAYNGMNGATIRFAGDDLQNVGLGTILKIEPYERNELRDKNRSRQLATIIHDGAGTLQLYGAPITCEKFVQSGGPLSLNGSAFGADTLEFSGRLISDVPWSGDTEGGEIVVYEKASFMGSVTDSVWLNTSEPWILRTFGAVIANYAVIGNGTVHDENATGIAFNSRDAGNTVRWSFLDNETALFSLVLPDTVTTNTVEPIILNVATVSSPSLTEPVTYRWTVDGAAVDNVSDQAFTYTDSAALSDNGKMVRVYAVIDGMVVDSSGPALLRVIDSPRIDKVMGRNYGVYGDIVDTVSVYAKLVAGVDSLHWFAVESEGEEVIYSALSVTTDTLSLVPDSTFLGGKRIAVIGYDTAEDPLAPDTAFVTIRADEIRYSLVNRSDTLAAGEPVTYEISVTKWTGSDSLSYRWYKDDEKLEIETPVLSIDSVSVADMGRYIGEIGVRHRKENIAAVDVRLTLRSVAVKNPGDMPRRFSFSTVLLDRFSGIRVAVPRKMTIAVTVMDMLGRTRARTHGVYESGYHIIELFAGGQSTRAPGGYILRVEAAGKTHVQKVLLDF